MCFWVWNRFGKLTNAVQEDKGIVWREWMEFALGVLHWTPETFWNSTPSEFWAAFTGWKKVTIPKKEGDNVLSSEEHIKLRSMLDDELNKDPTKSHKDYKVPSVRDIEKAFGHGYDS